ncbi:Hsp70 family protein [Nocardia sp. alder85J]|uniref:Hsp70 family protein n=1 Tax=Nocardia sp. alder85J TaxID=2862949 RepID=UPI001CD24950|nr:Hsp70 family protein [Nocardia sp. alder85J]MCX4091990.1 Hsp70 family protein [Nocardia sp. alder85J]
MGRAVGIGVGSDAFMVCVSGGEWKRVPAVLHLADGAPPVLGRAALAAEQAGRGAVFRDFTERVGDPVPLFAGDHPYTGAELLATAIGCLAGAGDEVMLAHPACWSDHASQQLRNALARLAFPVTLVDEAEATLIAAAEGPAVSGPGAVVLCDVGARYTDLSVLTPDSTGRMRLRHTERSAEFSGDLVDSLLLQHLLSAVAETEPGFDPAAIADVRAIELLRNRIRVAKEQLSACPAVTVDVELPGIRYAHRLVRAELEALVEDSMRPVVDRVAARVEEAERVQAARGAERSAEPRPRVLLSGGGSALPLLTEQLSAEITAPVVVLRDPATTAVRGAAALAARRIATRPPAAAHRVIPPSPESVRRPRPTPDARSKASRPQPAPAPPRFNSRRRAGWLVGAVAAIGVIAAGGVVAAEAVHAPAHSQTAPAVTVSQHGHH